MTEDDLIIGLEDLERDLDGTHKVEARLAAFFRGGKRPRVRTRGSRPEPPPPAAAAGIGGRLMAGCPAETQRRYRTLVQIEPTMPPDGDHGILIAAACAILEAELRRLLADHARPIVGPLIAALSTVKRKDPAEILARWQRGATPTTMGVLSVLLFALRRGCEQSLPEITRFLASRFRPHFVDLLRSKKMDAALEVIRTRFRNPADHAEDVFDAASYEAFVRLIVANRHFAAWDSDGPDPRDPDAGSGILYHHLQHALDTPAEDQTRSKGAETP
jgi:hypothetical protein